MAGFLYYFPQAAPVSNVEQIPDVELRTLLHDSSLAVAQNNGGPDGKVGQLVAVMPSPNAVGGVDANAGYWSDRQEWTAVKDADGKPLYWIGREKVSPPTPADVQRERLIYGHAVKLADGNEWTIPVVGPENTRLPRTFRALPGKRLMMAVREQYQAIFAASEKWHALARHGGEYDWHEAYAYACGLLAVNYRIGWWEAATLGLIDTDNFWQIAAASFGMPDLAKSLAAAQKKIQAASGSEASPGAAA